VPPPTSAPKPIRTVIAQQVAAIRKRRRWTQGELADQLSDLGWGNLSRAAIAKIETEKRGVSAEELVALAAALNVSPVNLCVPDNPGEPVEISPTIRVPAQRASAWFLRDEPIVASKEKEDQFYSEIAPDEWGRQKNQLVRELSAVFEHIIWISRWPHGEHEADQLYDRLFADTQRAIRAAETGLAAVWRRHGD
jgi:transcriptional regulator with XRE-family HTH domain